MQTINPSAVVLPSFSEFGVVSKKERGILPSADALPEVLRPMQSALNRLASKLGVDFDQDSAGLKASFEIALAGRAVQDPVQPAPSGGDDAPSGP